ncbi:hypothetical protein SEA_ROSAASANTEWAA_16 [Streptomyces phage RosaAsantewaa]|nr:hypothetical protein SEA_ROSAASANTEWAA_16 [Streptomyces phage RosaAsantewaa]
MATVTVVTAERTLEIEATSIVAADVNDDGHLILTRHDGTPIDAGAVSGMKIDPGTGYVKVDAFSYIGEADPGAVPDGSVWYDTNDVAGPFANETTRGLVELASTTETVAGTDTQRAVTPAGFAAGFSAAYAAVPGAKVQQIDLLTETALPSAYPVGISTMYLLSGSGWTVSSGMGTVVTVNLDADRCHQTFYMRTGSSVGLPQIWTRTHHSTDGGGGWTKWQQLMIMNYTTQTVPQSTGFTGFPPGLTRLYFTTATSTGWDFAGMAGELITYREGTDFGKQTFLQHTSGSSGKPQIWIRTANAANGWTPWRKTVYEDRVSKLPTAMLSGRLLITPSAANTPTSSPVTFPAGYFTTTPNIIVGMDTTVPGTQVTGVSAGNPSATGFNAIVTRTNTTDTWVQWVAIQM